MNETSKCLIQYIVIRTDLKTTWPLGALIAQGVHASVAAISQSSTHPHTIQYLADSHNMTTCVLGIDNEESLRDLAKRLKDAQIEHHLWIEQPENVAVSLATTPTLKTSVARLFKSLKLLK